MISCSTHTNEVKVHEQVDSPYQQLYFNNDKIYLANSNKVLFVENKNSKVILKNINEINSRDTRHLFRYTSDKYIESMCFKGMFLDNSLYLTTNPVKFNLITTDYTETDQRGMKYELVQVNSMYDITDTIFNPHYKESLVEKIGLFAYMINVPFKIKSLYRNEYISNNNYNDFVVGSTDRTNILFTINEDGILVTYPNTSYCIRIKNPDLGLGTIPLDRDDVATHEHIKGKVTYNDHIWGYDGEYIYSANDPLYFMDDHSSPSCVYVVKVQEDSGNRRKFALEPIDGKWIYNFTGAYISDILDYKNYIKQEQKKLNIGNVYLYNRYDHEYISFDDNYNKIEKVYDKTLATKFIYNNCYLKFNDKVLSFNGYTLLLTDIEENNNNQLWYTDPYVLISYSNNCICYYENDELYDICENKFNYSCINHKHNIKINNNIYKFIGASYSSHEIGLKFTQHHRYEILNKYKNDDIMFIKYIDGNIHNVISFYDNEEVQMIITNNENKIYGYNKDHLYNTYYDKIIYELPDKTYTNAYQFCYIKDNKIFCTIASNYFDDIQNNNLCYCSNGILRDLDPDGISSYIFPYTIYIQMRKHLGINRYKQFDLYNILDDNCIDEYGNEYTTVEKNEINGYYYVKINNGKYLQDVHDKILLSDTPKLIILKDMHDYPYIQNLTITYNGSNGSNNTYQIHYKYNMLCYSEDQYYPYHVENNELICKYKQFIITEESGVTFVPIEGNEYKKETVYYISKGINNCVIKDKVLINQHYVYKLYGVEHNAFVNLDSVTIDIEASELKIYEDSFVNVKTIKFKNCILNKVTYLNVNVCLASNPLYMLSDKLTLDTEQTIWNIENYNIICCTNNKKLHGMSFNEYNEDLIMKEYWAINIVNGKCSIKNVFYNRYINKDLGYSDDEQLIWILKPVDCNIVNKNKIDIYNGNIYEDTITKSMYDINAKDEHYKESFPHGQDIGIFKYMVNIPFVIHDLDSNLYLYATFFDKSIKFENDNTMYNVVSEYNKCIYELHNEYANSHTITSSYSFVVKEDGYIYVNSSIESYLNTDFGTYGTDMVYAHYMYEHNNNTRKISINDIFIYDGTYISIINNKRLYFSVADYGYISVNDIYLNDTGHKFELLPIYGEEYPYITHSYKTINTTNIPETYKNKVIKINSFEQSFIIIPCLIIKQIDNNNILLNDLTIVDGTNISIDDTKLYWTEEAINKLTITIVEDRELPINTNNKLYINDKIYEVK